MGAGERIPSFFILDYMGASEEYVRGRMSKQTICTVDCSAKSRLCRLHIIDDDDYQEEADMVEEDFVEVLVWIRSSVPLAATDHTPHAHSGLLPPSRVDQCTFSVPLPTKPCVVQR